MTDRPTGPAKPRRPTVANADRPSETLGLPDVGEGASAARFVRDAVSLNAGEGHKDTDGAAGPDDPKG